jgi:formate dehydrogenase major subunit
VGATWIKNAVARGAKLVLADPRRTDLARHAWRVLQFHARTPTWPCSTRCCTSS